MEKLTFNKLGQWLLHKSWSDAQQKKIVDDWGEGGNRSALHKIPKASADIRAEMLNSMDKEVKNRINPETGEKEYRMFRSHHPKDKSYRNNKTSWSCDPGFIHYWTVLSDEPRQISAAWIPERHIHSYLPPLQEKLKSDKNEGEALVMPHNVKIDKTIKNSEIKKMRNEYLKSNGPDYEHPSDYIE